MVIFELSAFDMFPGLPLPFLNLRSETISLPERAERKEKKKTQSYETRDVPFVAPLLVLVRTVETWYDPDEGRELVQPSTLSQHPRKTNPVST